MKQLLWAITIFLKYGDPDFPTHCEHDIMYICGIDPDDVTEKDKLELAEIGFDVTDDLGIKQFYSYKFGSA